MASVEGVTLVVIEPSLRLNLPRALFEAGMVSCPAVSLQPLGLGYCHHFCCPVSPAFHQAGCAGGHAHSVLQLPASTHHKLRRLCGVAPGNGSQWPVMMVFPGYTRKCPQMTVVVSGTWSPLNVSEAGLLLRDPILTQPWGPAQARLVESRMSPQPAVQDGFRVASCLDLTEASYLSEMPCCILHVYLVCCLSLTLECHCLRIGALVGSFIKSIPRTRAEPGSWRHSRNTCGVNEPAFQTFLTAFPHLLWKARSFCFILVSFLLFDFPRDC